MLEAVAASVQGDNFRRWRAAVLRDFSIVGVLSDEVGIDAQVAYERVVVLKVQRWLAGRVEEPFDVPKTVGSAGQGLSAATCLQVVP